MSVINLTKGGFLRRVMDYEKNPISDWRFLGNKPAIIDFYASWCGPCRMVSPLVDELAEEHPEFKFCKVNVDEQPELANRFKIMSIPSLISFKDGNLKDMSVGAKPKEQILEMLTSL